MSIILVKAYVEDHWYISAYVCQILIYTNLRIYKAINYDLFFNFVFISDVGKITSTQNHFGSTVQNQFNTKNNTRVIAQKGGLAILPCVVKVNSPATVRNFFAKTEINVYGI